MFSNKKKGLNRFPFNWFRIIHIIYLILGHSQGGRKKGAYLPVHSMTVIWNCMFFNVLSVLYCCYSLTSFSLNPSLLFMLLMMFMLQFFPLLLYFHNLARSRKWSNRCGSISTTFGTLSNQVCSFSWNWFVFCCCCQFLENSSLNSSRTRLLLDKYLLPWVCSCLVISKINTWEWFHVSKYRIL